MLTGGQEHAPRRPAKVLGRGQEGIGTGSSGSGGWRRPINGRLARCAEAKRGLGVDQLALGHVLQQLRLIGRDRHQAEPTIDRQAGWTRDGLARLRLSPLPPTGRLRLAADDRVVHQHVRKLMRQQSPAGFGVRFVLAGRKADVVAGGEGTGADRGGVRCGFRVIVDTHAGEVGTEPAAKKGSGGRVKRASGAGKHGGCVRSGGGGRAVRLAPEFRLALAGIAGAAARAGGVAE